MDGEAEIRLSTLLPFQQMCPAIASSEYRRHVTVVSDASQRIILASWYQMTHRPREATVFTSSSRTVCIALIAYHSHVERRRSIAQVRALDDHIPRQLGLNRVKLMAM